MQAAADILPPPSLSVFSLGAAPPGLGEEAGSKMVQAISAALSSTAAALRVKDEGRRTASGEVLEPPVNLAAGKRDRVGEGLEAPACGLPRPACPDFKGNETGAAPHAQGGPGHAAAVTEVDMVAAANREVTEDELATLGAFVQAEGRGERSAVVQSPRTPRDHGCASACLLPARDVKAGGGQGATDGGVAGARHGGIEMLAPRLFARGIDPPRTPDGLPLPKAQAMEEGAKRKGKRVALRALQLESVPGRSPGPRPLIFL